MVSGRQKCPVLGSPDKRGKGVLLLSQFLKIYNARDLIYFKVNFYKELTLIQAQSPWLGVCPLLCSIGCTDVIMNVVYRAVLYLIQRVIINSCAVYEQSNL